MEMEKLERQQTGNGGGAMNELLQQVESTTTALVTEFEAQQQKPQQHGVNGIMRAKRQLFTMSNVSYYVMYHLVRRVAFKVRLDFFF